MWSFRCKQGALSSATVIASKNSCKDKNNIFNIQIFFLSAKRDSNPQSCQHRRFLQLIIPSTPCDTQTYSTYMMSSDGFATPIPHYNFGFIQIFPDLIGRLYHLSTDRYLYSVRNSNPCCRNENPES